jgi:hypothetical protein
MEPIIQRETLFSTIYMIKIQCTLYRLGHKTTAVKF